MGISELYFIEIKIVFKKIKYKKFELRLRSVPTFEVNTVNRVSRTLWMSAGNIKLF